MSGSQALSMLRYSINYKNMPMKYTENVLVVKMKIFTGKILIFFLFVLKT